MSRKHFLQGGKGSLHIHVHRGKKQFLKYFESFFSFQSLQRQDWWFSLPDTPKQLFHWGRYRILLSSSACSFLLFTSKSLCSPSNSCFHLHNRMVALLTLLKTYRGQHYCLQHSLIPYPLHTIFCIYTGGSRIQLLQHFSPLVLGKVASACNNNITGN